MIRWTVTGLLLLLSGFLIVGNPVAGRRAVRAGRGYSSVPFIGGLAGAAAILVSPWPMSAWWVLLPLTLDYTIPLFVFQVLSGRDWK